MWLKAEASAMGLNRKLGNIFFWALKKRVVPFQSQVSLGCRFSSKVGVCDFHIAMNSTLGVGWRANAAASGCVNEHNLSECRRIRKATE